MARAPPPGRVHGGPLARARASAATGPVAQRAQRRSLVRAWRGGAPRIRQQAMMGVMRRRPAHQHLQQACRVGGRQRILPARHQRHALPRVVNASRRDGRRPDVLARQHRIAEPCRGRSFAARPCSVQQTGPPAAASAAAMSRRKRMGARRGAIRAPAPPPAAAGRCPDRAARPGHAGGRARRDLPRECRRACRSRDRAARAPRAHPASRGSPADAPTAPHLAIPVEPQPGEVLQDRRGEVRAAAQRVDVLEAQQEAPARLARRRQAISAECAWPRCRKPVGLGAIACHDGCAMRRTRSGRPAGSARGGGMAAALDSLR